jgi:hypothetical protein
MSKTNKQTTESVKHVIDKTSSAAAGAAAQAVATALSNRPRMPKPSGRDGAVSPAQAKQLKAEQKKLRRELAAVTSNSGDPYAVKIAKGLVSPLDAEPFRVQDGYSAFPTSVHRPFEVLPAVWKTGTGSSLGVPDSQSFAVLTRDARCFLRYMHPNPSSTPYQYNYVSDSGESLITQIAGIAIMPAFWTANSAFAPHGGVLWSAKPSPDADGAPARMTLFTLNQSLTINGLPASTSVTVTLSVMIGNDREEYILAVTTSGVGAATFPFANFTNRNVPAVPLTDQFFHASIVVSHAITSGSIYFSGSGPLVAQRTLADFETVVGAFDTMRINSMSLMYTNTAAQLDRNGYVASWQCPRATDFVEYVRAGFDEFANRPEALRDDAKDGWYTWFKPSSAVDWQFNSVSTVQPPGSALREYDAYMHPPVSDYLMIFLSVPIDAGRAGYWTAAACVEARTNSVWQSTDYAPGGPSSLERALMAVRRAPQGRCNPLHVKDLFDWVRRHKQQLHGTINIGEGIAGSRALPVTSVLHKLLDTWF